MRKLLLASIIFLLVSNCFAQLPNWVWAKNYYSNVRTTAIKTDASGNIYTAGAFKNATITFGSITLTNPSPTFENMFLLKTDNAGNVIWAKTAGNGGGDAYVNAMAIDTNGNILVTGHYDRAAISFGSILLNGGGFFLVKYDNGGNEIWAKKAGTTGTATGNSISVTSSGNIFVLGSFICQYLFLGSFTLTNPSGGQGYNEFIVRYDNNGNVLWAKKGMNEMGTAITTDNFGNIYTAGWGPSTNSNFTKHDTLGNLIWTSNWGKAYPKSLACDSKGNIFGTGFFQNSMQPFGSITLVNQNSPYYDAFVVCYYNFGITKWAKRCGGTDDDFGCSLSIDNSGNCIIAGKFKGASASFGSNTLTNYSSVYSDIFIAKYDSAGNALCAESAGGNYNDEANAITQDANGNYYVAGTTSSSSIFFAPNIGFYTSGSDMFIAKLTEIPTGITEEKNKISFSIFPNPGSGIFNLTDSQTQTKIQKFIITDIYGNKILQVQNTIEEINLLNQPSGIYFVTAISAGASYTQKLLIQK